MNIQEAMTFLTQCGLGAAVLSSDDSILLVNDMGDRLLHGDGQLPGKSLLKLAPELCGDENEQKYANVVFGEYLIRNPAPSVEGLSPDQRLIVFRNATNDACHDMLIGGMNQLNEALALFDAKGRVWMLNDACTKMDSMVIGDILGEPVETLYTMQDNEEYVIPKVIRDKKSVLNRRHHYLTRFGKEVDVRSNAYPLVQNGQVLGGINIMEDPNAMDNFHRQLILLQDRLLDDSTADRRRKKSALPARYTFKDIVHVSRQMHDLIVLCKRVARTDSPVMIYGETGTGKELIAQSIHNASSRAKGPFLAINCAAIPESLLEGLLFGTERGAYTGAEQRPGILEQANKGTLLLDEINSMNIFLQSKLLRFLQEGVFRRIGGTSEIHVDVRILSNINIPPKEALEKKLLRQDLYYRLSAVTIDIPPLRERREDIPVLAKHFIMRYNRKLRRNVKNISNESLSLLKSYDFPGNVRELQSAIEYAMNVLPDEQSSITSDVLPSQILRDCCAPQEPELPLGERSNEALSDVFKSLYQPLPSQGNSPIREPLRDTMQSIEYDNVIRALIASGGNISKAARLLHMSRQNLQYRIRRYHIDLGKLK